jgi:hypothetical protein
VTYVANLGLMSDVCRELGWGIRLMGSVMRSGELSVWLGFDDFETCWARSDDFESAGHLGRAPYYYL